MPAPDGSGSGQACAAGIVELSEDVALCVDGARADEELGRDFLRSRKAVARV
jgi:hypothetical protein